VKRGVRVTIWFLTLGVGLSLAAQEAAPESKNEPTSQQPPAPQPQAPVRIRVSRGVSQGLIVKKVQPEYPPEAREQRIQGEVVLRVMVSRQGDVSKVSLISGHPLLAPAAMDAVKQWKYQPFLLNGQPLEVDTEVVVNFRLESSEQPANDITPPDLPPVLGIVVDAPGGIPSGQTDVIRGIISSTPVPVPRIAAPQRVRVSQGISSGLLVKKVNPDYPLEARRGRIQGTVVLHVLISKAGDITTVELVSGHPALAPEAIRVVKQWKYKPYLLNGKPVEADTEILINFTLSGS
jgi:TonB family protein